ncbi:site-specific integrase [uncultured Tenacibaculum sp.]|uniref:tyrosine-type recombinase/integrase n=1 Tax=uncultured Tenacibaculum sp. TaxID=174713 RepID=UPI002604DD44|nr:site-specific integrase [uncultured Tenacibaculum sp.]
MKLNFSSPKIYTGGVLISEWSKLSKLQKEEALNKDWFVYYSYRNPKTQKLQRQPYIKAGVNKLKTKRERIAFLRTMQKALLQLLQAGFNPYKDNSALEAELFSDANENTISNVTAVEEKITQEKTQKVQINSEAITEIEETSIVRAFELGLGLKEKLMNKNSFTKYKSRINRFSKWLKTKGYEKQSVKSLDKKLIIQYLNEVLQSSSARNRNNTRTDISSLFQILEDNEIIKENYVKKINVLKSIPKRNKTYTPQLQKDIYNYLEKNDRHLLLFIQFISYNFLRPIEVCRLRVEDIDIKDKKLYVKAKNSPVKIKIIPDILINQLPDLTTKDGKSFLFTQNEIGGEWDIEEENKRDHFTKRFKKIKEFFKLGKEYGLYSFRHTFITKLYRELRKTYSPFETKSKLMLITGHTTITALEKYLRDIDAELPEDYSLLIK